MDCDYLVIGGGIAGASAAFELANHGRVVLAERETTLGYHTTGRSAAMFLENYGEAPVRALAGASREFLSNPPDGFAASPLIAPRGVLFLARQDQLAKVEASLAAKRDRPGIVVEISPARAREMIPILKPGYLASALFEEGASEMDVNALHQGFLRGLKARGGQVNSDAGVTALERRHGQWHATTRAGDMAAAVVVNAAGAWADEVAGLAGVAPIGLVPKRRTAFTFDPPAGTDPSAWPMAVDADEEFYFKVEAGRVLGSPADETPMAPCDVQPEELDIAIAVDRIQRAADVDIRRITHSWAGLRSFVDDHLPVVGYDPDVDGFFWLAGQGGIGIMTSPAISRMVGALATGGELPSDVTDFGVTAATLAPERLRA